MFPQILTMFLVVRARSPSSRRQNYCAGRHTHASVLCVKTSVWSRTATMALCVTCENGLWSRSFLHLLTTVMRASLLLPNEKFILEINTFVSRNNHIGKWCERRSWPRRRAAQRVSDVLHHMPCERLHANVPRMHQEQVPTKRSKEKNRRGLSSKCGYPWCLLRSACP